MSDAKHLTDPIYSIVNQLTQHTNKSQRRINTEHRSTNLNNNNYEYNI